MHLWVSLIIYGCLLLLSAFFSGSESAFFSLPSSELRKLRKNKESASARRIVRLLEKPRRLLTTLLIGNTIVNVAAATLAALLTSRMLSDDGRMEGWGFAAMIAVVTITILFFGEIVPKVFAVKTATKFVRRAAPVIEGLTLLLFPVSFVFERLTGLVTRLLGIKKEVPFVNEEELKAFIEVGEEKGTLDPAEREMIHSIFEFRKTMVKEIMVPRIDMVAIEKDTPFDEVLVEVKSKRHSRIPVYEEKIDNIIGILYSGGAAAHRHRGG
jgi:putative hemolysin